jgi:CRISPR/Cas system-associated exonuclease Cas4 (RecB family)
MRLLRHPIQFLETRCRSQRTLRAGKLSRPGRRSRVLERQSGVLLPRNHLLSCPPYALLLEEHRGITVTRGFLYLIPHREMVEVPIAPRLRKQVGQMLNDTRLIAVSERMPAATGWRQRCADCEFRSCLTCFSRKSVAVAQPIGPRGTASVMIITAAISSRAKN